ncbi:nitrile hydratase accessory protein [Streptomyces brasiliscabiei]|uniref:Nitrile hydratase accessory protein n=1 Tax=Streptomyces brasiliscabiei TaxID=2736302 RepID=A0ABU8GN30_9ACTN
MAKCETLTEDSVRELHQAVRAPREGDEAFRIPWELRSFALGLAFYEEENFPWEEFQSRLIAAIDRAGQDIGPEHYYARWMEALESLLTERAGIDLAVLDERTADVLRTPRDATHQHAHEGPVTVKPGHSH